MPECEQLHGKRCRSYEPKHIDCVCTIHNCPYTVLQRVHAKALTTKLSLTTTPLVEAHSASECVCVCVWWKHEIDVYNIQRAIACHVLAHHCEESKPFIPPLKYLMQPSSSGSLHLSDTQVHAFGLGDHTCNIYAIILNLFAQMILDSDTRIFEIKAFHRPKSAH